MEEKGEISGELFSSSSPSLSWWRSWLVRLWTLWFGERRLLLRGNTSERILNNLSCCSLIFCLYLLKIPQDCWIDLREFLFYFLQCFFIKLHFYSSRLSLINHTFYIRVPFSRPILVAENFWTNNIVCVWKIWKPFWGVPYDPHPHPTLA